MHASALLTASLFFKTYEETIRTSFLNLPQSTIVDVGAMDVNGTLKEMVPTPLQSNYIGLDMAAGPNVDIVLLDPYQLPLPDDSCAVVTASSVFEHCPFFWSLFEEMTRIAVSATGLIYLSVPFNGWVHRYPEDCWRFYPDAGHALEAWARRRGFEVTLVESFVLSAEPKKGEVNWQDFVAVFVKGDFSEADMLPSRVYKQIPKERVHFPYSYGENLPQVQTKASPDFEQILGLSA